MGSARSPANAVAVSALLESQSAGQVFNGSFQLCCSAAVKSDRLAALLFEKGVLSEKGVINPNSSMLFVSLKDSQVAQFSSVCAAPLGPWIVEVDYLSNSKLLVGPCLTGFANNNLNIVNELPSSGNGTCSSRMTESAPPSKI